jgi:DNA (cytosine-5)-methyltransferase 1
MNEGKTRTHLDLFSGIGGFALAARWAGYQTIAFCEQDEYCQRVLERHWPEVPCLKDVHDLDGKDYEGVTLLTGGFPCQPYSHAGKRRGKDDDRAIGGEMVRIISEARPAWVLGENVSGFATMGLDDMLSDLESLGYACQTFCVPACAVNAPHRRDRLWIVANSESLKRGSSRHTLREKEKNSRFRNGSKAKGEYSGPCEWSTEPGVRRVANGIPRRVDRLKGLGNAIVPHVAYEIIKEMT